MRHSPKTQVTAIKSEAKKEVSSSSPRGSGSGTGSGSAAAQKSGNNSGSGNDTTKRRQHHRQSQRPILLSSSSSDDESNLKQNSSAKMKASHHRPWRRNSKDLLELRSYTNPRSKSSPKQMLAKQTKHKSSESILDDHARHHREKQFKHNSKSLNRSKPNNWSENELLDADDNFDFTSSRLLEKTPPVAPPGGGSGGGALAPQGGQTSKKSNKASGPSGPFDFLLNKPSNILVIDPDPDSKKSDNSSDTKHEPFGSTEFPTMKRKVPISQTGSGQAAGPSSLPVLPVPPVPISTGSAMPPENEYESMTSLDVRDSMEPQTIRASLWTPPGSSDNAGAGPTGLVTKTIDGLSSPSVITSNQDQDESKKVDPEPPIEPPPNFGSEKPPPLPVKKFGKSRKPKHDPGLVIDSSQVRMAGMAAAQERDIREAQRQQQARNKRIRNRSLEMVLDGEPRSSDSSPSRQRWI